jgi:hypothetical protein
MLGTSASLNTQRAVLDPTIACRSKVLAEKVGGDGLELDHNTCNATSASTAV